MKKLSFFVFAVSILLFSCSGAGGGKSEPPAAAAPAAPAAPVYPLNGTSWVCSTTVLGQVYYTAKFDFSTTTVALFAATQDSSAWETEPTITLNYTYNDSTKVVSMTDSTGLTDTVTIENDHFVYFGETFVKQ